MIEIRRVAIREGPLEMAGRAYTLVGTQWTVAATTRRFGVGAAYTAPSHIESNGSRYPVRDYVLIMRITVAVVVAVAALARRSSA